MESDKASRDPGVPGAAVRAYFAEATAGAAAKFMARPTDPALGRSLSTAGIRMPTRARRTAGLAALLGALDGAIAAVESSMGEPGTRPWSR